MKKKIISPPNISGATLFNILEYICHGRLISIQTRYGEKVSFAPLTLSYVLQGPKNIEKMAPRKLYVLLHHVSTPFLLTFGKNWNLWNAFLDATHCVCGKKVSFFLLQNRIFNSRKHSALRVSFICCMRWPTVAHWLARDGWFAETAGVLLPKPPGQWIQI